MPGARNRKRKKRSWRMQNQGARRKGKSGKRKKAGVNLKQAGRVNPQVANTRFTVVTAECQCGAINCDGCKFFFLFLLVYVYSVPDAGYSRPDAYLLRNFQRHVQQS